MSNKVQLIDEEVFAYDINSEARSSAVRGLVRGILVGPQAAGRANPQPTMAVTTASGTKQVLKCVLLVDVSAPDAYFHHIDDEGQPIEGNSNPLKKVYARRGVNVFRHLSEAVVQEKSGKFVDLSVVQELCDAGRLTVELDPEGEAQWTVEEAEAADPKAELMAMKGPELKAKAQELGIDVNGMKKADIVDAILEEEMAL